MRRTSKSDEPIKICKDIPISLAAGAHAVNFFQLFGTVRIIDQAAEIVGITTLTNCSNVYASLYDGTNTEILTLDGIDLGGAPVGTVFTKDKDVTQPYSLSKSDQCRVNEVVNDRWIGKPFTVTQKNGANTFIRFHLTTTDDPIVFVMRLRFEWKPLDGGRLHVLV
jgi:hypothetical protein